MGVTVVKGHLFDGKGAGKADAALLTLALLPEDVEFAARPDGLEGVRPDGLRRLHGGGRRAGEQALATLLLLVRAARRFRWGLRLRHWRGWMEAPATSDPKGESRGRSEKRGLGFLFNK